jgi:hypothetical protein
MNDRDRFKLLHGPYRTPRFRYGARVFCEVRGEVVICGLTDARIPWPVGKKGRARSLVVNGGLAKAVLRESATAVCHWWGVTAQTLSVWRKALGVVGTNEGTRRLRGINAAEVLTEEVVAKGRAASHAPEVEARRSATLMGRPMNPKVRAIFDRARRQPHSLETRKKMSETHRRIGTRPRHDVPPWTPEQDALLGTLPDAEVAVMIRRTELAVLTRRCRLRIPCYNSERSKMRGGRAGPARS